MANKKFWFGIGIAVCLTVLYHLIPSFKKDEDGSKVDTLTLWDINYTAENPPKKIPDATLTFYKNSQSGSLDGESKKISDFQGKPVILHFWATWCQPCVKELPKYDEFSQSGSVVNLAVVSDGSSAQTIQAFYEKHSIKNLSIITEQSGALLRAMQISGLPTTVFINKEGREVGRVTGMVQWEDPKVVNLLLRQIS